MQRSDPGTNWVTDRRIPHEGHSLVVGARSALGADAGRGVRGARGRVGPVVGVAERRGAATGARGMGNGGSSTSSPTSKNASATSSGTGPYQLPISNRVGMRPSVRTYVLGLAPDASR